MRSGAEEVDDRRISETNEYEDIEETIAKREETDAVKGSCRGLQEKKLELKSGES